MIQSLAEDKLSPTLCSLFEARLCADATMPEEEPAAAAEPQAEGNAEASDDVGEEEEPRRSNGQSRNRQWIDDFAKRKKAMKIKIKAQYEELNSAAFVIKCPEGEMPNCPNTITDMQRE